MTFSRISLVMTIITFTLFALLLFAPDVIFSLFQVEGNDSADFISRRAAMLFLGIAILSWLGRNAQHSESRQAVCMGLSVSMSALAILGTFELIRGFAGPGILLAVAAETALGISYFSVWIRNRNA